MKNSTMSKRVFEELKKHLDEFREQQQDILKENVPDIMERKKIDGLFKSYVEKLENLLSNAQTSCGNDFNLPFTVIGSEVELENLQNKCIHKIRIVLPKQNLQGSGKIMRASCLSPMGLAMFLKKSGEAIEVNAPSGHCHYRIKSIYLPFT